MLYVWVCAVAHSTHTHTHTVHDIDMLRRNRIHKTCERVSEPRTKCVVHVTAARYEESDKMLNEKNSFVNGLLLMFGSVVSSPSLILFTLAFHIARCYVLCDNIFLLLLSVVCVFVVLLLHHTFSMSMASALSPKQTTKPESNEIKNLSEYTHFIRTHTFHWHAVCSLYAFDGDLTVKLVCLPFFYDFLPPTLCSRL